MKTNNRLFFIFSIIAIISVFSVGTFSIWYASTTRPPHAEITSISDIKNFKSAEDWYGKVVRWEVLSVTTQNYDSKKDEYGFLGYVRITGASDMVIAGLSTKDKNKKYDIEEGDIVYAKTYGIEKVPLLGNLVKGDILYVEKKGSNK